MSAMLAAVFFCASGANVRAAELPEEILSFSAAETVPVVTETEPPAAETMPVPAESLPPETEAAVETTQPTVPAETIPETTAVTEPVMETMPPVTEETAPEETVPVTEPEATLPEQETAPPETETETLPEIAPPVFPDPVPVTVADARAMDPGEECLLRGTLVWIRGTRAVLQDSTGGIRLEFFEKTGGSLGEVMEITGQRTAGGIAVTDYTFAGMATLPEREITLPDAPENIRVCIRGGVLNQGYLQQNGHTLALEADLPQSAEGSRLDVWGVILEGVLYADCAVPAEAEAAPAAAGIQSDWNFYFGLLHAHTEISDGVGTVEEAFAHAAGVEGLDFFAVTDHSDSFDNADAGSIDADGAAISREWAAGKAAAAAVTGPAFVGIFGYEMTWPEALKTGHINTFCTPGWQTRDQKGFESPEGYYAALGTVPQAVSMFNHPSHAYGNFSYFTGYSPEADRVMHLLEVGSEGGMVAYDLYTQALDQGWHLAPANNQNNHNGGWGDLTAQRTVVLAQERTEEAIFDAIRHYRVYATEDNDLLIHYQLNNQILGSVLPPTEELVLRAALEDPTDASLGVLEVIGDGGAVVARREITGNAADIAMELPGGCSYYYLRLTQADGDVAVTAPVWIDTYEDMGIDSFTCRREEIAVGEEAVLELTLYNWETVPFLVESAEVFVGQTRVWSMEDTAEVAGMGTEVLEIPFCWQEPGRIHVKTVVTGWVEGMQRQYEAEQELILVRRLPQEPEETTPVPDITPIGQVRQGTPGGSCRIKGYVTAGTANPYNRFPNTIYLQDDSGGIAVTGWYRDGLQVGTPLEITGILVEQGGCPVLELVEETAPGGTYYRYVPKTMGNKLAMDYAARGGQLLQVEGTVVALTRTADGYGISRFTVKDIRGDLAEVVIEDTIRSGAYGTNELAAKIKKGRTVRAMGLLHLDTAGNPVLRVRNCDEVVYVPPKADPTNPKTGDRFWDRWLVWR